ncbi:MAG: energy transducer TonB [Marinilabiliales bacterium]|nr:MAG: energy transducer TonB [Marinilabiliales bacterium]
MKEKKDKKQNLERFKTMFFQVGLLLTLAAVLFAFEWKSVESDESNGFDVQLPPDIIPETVITIEKKKEKEIQRQDLEITDDEEECEDLDIDAEFNEDEALDDFDYEDIEDEYVEPDDDNSVILIPGIMPEFPGGEEALFLYLGNNIKYPRAAREIDLQGTVILQFIIEKDGSVSNVVVARGIGGGCDEEAVRVVQKMPKWTPGKQYGRPVRVQYTLPVRFVLQ